MSAGQLLLLHPATKTEGLDNLAFRLNLDESDYEVRFDLAVCQVKR